MCDSPFRNGKTVSECSGALLVREDSKTFFESPETHMNNDNMDINIKTLFMDRFNIDIMKESVTLQLIGMGEILLPLKLIPRIKNEKY